MTQPNDAPHDRTPSAFAGTDISIDPADLDREVPTPATSDPDEMTDDEALGGVGGGSPGGAG